MTTTQENYRVLPVNLSTWKAFEETHQHLDPDLVKLIRDKSIGTIDPFTEAGFQDIKVNSYYLAYERPDTRIDRTREIRDIRRISLGQVTNLTREDRSGSFDAAFLNANFIYEPAHIDWKEEHAYNLLTVNKEGVEEKFDLIVYQRLPKFVPLSRDDIEYLYARARVGKHLRANANNEFRDENVIMCFEYGLREILTSRKLPIPKSSE